MYSPLSGWMYLDPKLDFKQLINFGIVVGFLLISFVLPGGTFMTIVLKRSSTISQSGNWFSVMTSGCPMDKNNGWKIHQWFFLALIASFPLPINLPWICSFFVYNLHNMCCIPFSGEEWISALERTLLFQVLCSILALDTGPRDGPLLNSAQSSCLKIVYQAIW